MSDELVNQIVQRVLDELKRQGLPVGWVEPQRGDDPPSAPKRSGATGSPGFAQPGRSPLASAEREPPARIWLTADALAERMRGSSAVILGANEYLTPAARDYAQAKGVDVRRGQTPVKVERVLVAAPDETLAPAVLTGTLGLVVAGRDGKGEAALAGLGRAGVSTVGFAQDTCWMRNTQAMCAQVADGQLAGGVLIGPYAAAGMILAAKIKGIRPVQGVSAAAVAAGLRQFDANVLVIGHETVSVYEIRTMIERFAAGRAVRRDRTGLLAAIEELEKKV